MKNKFMSQVNKKKEFSDFLKNKMPGTVMVAHSGNIHCHVYHLGELTDLLLETYNNGRLAGRQEAQDEIKNNCIRAIKQVCIRNDRQRNFKKTKSV